MRKIESLGLEEMQEILGDILAYKRGEISLQEFSELWKVGSLTVLQ